MCLVFVTQIGKNDILCGKHCVSTVKTCWHTGTFISNFKDSPRFMTQDTNIGACKFSTIKTYLHASRAHANFKDQGSQFTDKFDSSMSQNGPKEPPLFAWALVPTFWQTSLYVCQKVGTRSALTRVLDIGGVKCYIKDFTITHIFLHTSMYQ